MPIAVWNYRRGVVERASSRDLFEAIYMLVSLVPVGRVVSYESVAELLSTSPRTVGIALKHNERPIVVPCHRVVGSSGELRGYSVGGAGVKRKLLQLEGVEFENSRVSKKSFVNLRDLLGGSM